jgi:hypothetical protein
MGKLKKATGIDIAAPVRAVQSGISSIGNATGISPALTKVFQPVEKAIVQPAGQGLASFDKMVGKTIPGGWGTVAAIAGSAMGVPTPYLVGLGALQGSGVTRKGGSFNLQGALIGGATAYASAELGDYLRSAAPGAEGIAGVTPPPTVDAAGNIINQATGQVGSGLAGNASGLIADPSMLTSANIAQLNALSAPLEAGAGIGLQAAPPPSILSQVMSGNFGDAISQAGTNIGNAASNVGSFAQDAGRSIVNAPSDAFNAVSNFDYSSAVDKGLSNASQTGAGIKNLLTGPAGVSKAASALSGVNPVTMGGMAVYGAASLSDLDAQRDFLKAQQEAGKIDQASYDAALAEINRSEAVARDAVARNPFNSNPDRSATMGETTYRRGNANETLYGRFDPSERLYAKGGEVEHFFLGGLSKAVKAIVENSEKGGIAAGSPVGFQNLRSEGVPTSQLDAQGLGALLNPIRSVSTQFANTPISLGDTLYDRRSDKNRIYDELMGRKYAMGGSIDEESGMDEARGMMQGNLQKGLFGQGYAKGGEAKERRDYLDMINADLRLPSAQYVEGMGFMTPPPSVLGRLGANFDALGGNIRAGVSGNAMMDQDRKVRARPEMIDVGYKGKVGRGELDVGLQRAIQSMPGRNKDYAVNAKYSMKFAEGGQPRFLSGGGDGMSDSIKASINGTQEARLADGEFVIPADVVSHLGNGSSKAGAKRLYSMMDKVRTARTGTKRQGKQINPKQFMPV